MGIAYQKILTFCNATHSQSTIIVLELLCAIFCATNCKYIRCWPTTLYVAIFIFAIISLTSISISFDSIFIRWCGCTIVHRTLGYTIYVQKQHILAMKNTMEHRASKRRSFKPQSRPQI